MIDLTRLAIRMCPTPTAIEWYNPAAYAAPTTPYTFGDAGRNSLMGPGYGEVDLSLTKSFAITEKTHLGS